jgi:ribosome-associated translation inhibitor RaiA
MATQTQQDAIREMANKKLLNGEQRKTLYKLFGQKIDNLLAKFKDKKSKERDGFENQILEAGRKNPTIKKILQDVETAKKLNREAEKAIKKIGFELTNENDRDTEPANISLRYSQHPELQAWDKKQDGHERKIEELKLKLLADIYGLPMTYDELTEYVEEKIAKIEATA